MKKILFVALVAIMALGLVSTAMAAVTGSVHDIGALVGNTELCGFCHAPHSQGRTNSTDGPIWSHEGIDATGYTMYTSSSLDGVAGAEPTGVSKACLGCHDGTVALDSYQGATGTNFISANKQIPNDSVGSQDLRGTHPISITYVDDAAGDPNATMVNKGLGIGNAGNIEDYLEGGTTLQCHSCHDVHNDGIEVAEQPLLREVTVGSALCLACHIK